jgi:phospholipid transport system substrate-binding protein
VETRIVPKDGEAMTVRWRVMQRENEWRVVDVEVLGLWLAIEQRAQIAAILDKPRATIDDAIAALSS